MIYLDHNATSPLLPEVLAAMEPWFGVPANPASAHRAGQRAAAAVERARDAVAALVGGASAGVVFTSGATEANHAALHGAHRQSALGPIALDPTAHPSLQAAAKATGRPVVPLPVDREGRLDLAATPEDAALIAVGLANHETGVLADVEALRAHAERLGAWLHLDATQAAGRTPLALDGVDSVALSGHKLGGPGGVGALVLQGGAAFPALLAGGGQERGRRAGTVHTAAVVGLGRACTLARAELEERRARWDRLRPTVERALEQAGARIAGSAAPRVPNTVCGVFDDLLGESLVLALDQRGLCVSAGAACASGSLRASPVLTAMGLDNPEGGLRVSLGPRSTRDAVEAFVEALPLAVDAVREAAAWA